MNAKLQQFKEHLGNARKELTEAAIAAEEAGLDKTAEELKQVIGDLVVSERKIDKAEGK